MTAEIFLCWTVNPFCGHHHAAWLLHQSCSRWFSVCPSGLSISHMSALNCICWLSHLKDANPSESVCIVFALSGRRSVTETFLYFPAHVNLFWLKLWEKKSKGVTAFMFPWMWTNAQYLLWVGLHSDPVWAPAFVRDFLLLLSVPAGGGEPVILLLSLKRL